MADAHDATPRPWAIDPANPYQLIGRSEDGHPFVGFINNPDDAHLIIYATKVVDALRSGGGWKYVPQHVAEGPSEVRHPDGWLICTTSSDELAALIVRAVNHFDEAVDTLKEARQNILDLAHSRGSEVEGTDDELVVYIDDVLSKLEAAS
ncbi:hypothetical protein CHELA1G11_13033 [Hyphomicrobiales bacterium]|nr:hypothetical protein CHELA1G2_11277 [Hyphomicrobiales bacterium]CAH1668836.1 hypothetical protein CHELA1G11_13033 [Hyphomicrobiales bacterium]